MIFLLALVFGVSVLGIMFPYGFPFYSLLVLFIFSLIFLTKKRLIIFHKYFIVLYILEILFLLSQLQTDVLYEIISKEIINLITLNFLLINFLNIINNPYQFKKFYNYIEKIVFIFGSIVSIIGIIKFIFLSNGVILNYFKFENVDYPWGTSLVSDYNYFSFGLIMAIIFGYSLFQKVNNFISKSFILSSIILMIVTIILSGSRRGLIIIFFIFFIFLIKNIFSKYRLNINSIKNKLSYIFLIFLSILVASNMNIDFSNTFYQVELLINRSSSILDILEKDSSFNPRIIRWEYAGKLIDEYSIGQILIGNGFEYIELYGKKFASEIGEGYPHNLIISEMLHSGIIGLFVLFILYYQIFKIYLIYFSELKILFYFFFIATIFNLSSANTFFSLKIYLLLIILPLIYHKIKVKEKNNA